MGLLKGRGKGWDGLAEGLSKEGGPGGHTASKGVKGGQA